MAIKVAIIGAGSIGFTRMLMKDILSVPELLETTFAFTDINKNNLDGITQLARRDIKANKVPAKILPTTNRKRALEGADYVIVTIQVGGSRLREIDMEIAAKYGVSGAIGDTIGPSGVFYGSRHIPVILDICHDMEELCPDAWLINYTNSVAMLCWAINDYTRIKNVGLCHSVQGTSRDLATYLGVPHDEITYWVAGINHMAWFLELKWCGEDAYPLLREKFKDPEIYSRPDAHWAGADNVRVEIFKAFGYFNTESSQHMSEYVPYFRKRPELLERFNLVDRTGLMRTFERIEKRRREQDEELKQPISSGQKSPINHSGEYGSIIIHSIETGIPSRINGNVKNNSLITNLLEGCCVEVPCLIDKTGISPCHVGDLPPQCAALNRTNINLQELAVKGIVEKDKAKIFQSILLDPLTSAILTIDETRLMVDEMFQAGTKYLKGFK